MSFPAEMISVDTPHPDSAVQLQAGPTPTETIGAATNPGDADPQATAREQVLCSLTPFFLDGAAGDPDSARAAARYMLDGYSTETTEELQIAAQIIACGFAALDSLRRAAADKALSVNMQLRLRGSANAMNRAVQQGREALDLRRRARATPQTAGLPLDQPLDPIVFQAAIQKAADAVAFARSDLGAADKPLTYWQQRRAAERDARLSKRRNAASAAQPVMPDIGTI